MIVVKRDKMIDGTKIQIEDWSINYDFYSKNSTIGAYPIARENENDNPFSAGRGETFRLELDFENEEQCKNAFDMLKSGQKTLKDFGHYAINKRHIQII